MSHYYDRSDLEKIPDLIGLANRETKAFLSFEKEVYSEEGKVEIKTKELIAIAVAHVVGCPYCIDVHVQKYRNLGGTEEEIMEAVLVAASTRSGAILSHATQIFNAFRKEGPNERAEKKSVECFC